MHAAVACSSNDKRDSASNGATQVPTARRTQATTSTAGGAAGSGFGEAGATDDGGGSGDSSDSSSSTATGAGGSGVGGSGGGGTGGSDIDGGSAGEAGAPEVSEPLLDALSVSGIGDPLNPDFDPEVQRYSVIALDSGEAPVVTAQAASDLAISINGNPATSGDPVTLAHIEPGSEIEVQVENVDGAQATYTLLYLPSDFPNLTVTTHTPLASTDPIYVAMRHDGVSYLAKLNNDGVPLFYRRSDGKLYDFKKHPVGKLSYAGPKNSRSGEQIVLGPDFTELERLTTVGLTNTDVHEFLIQPNGNYILLAYEPTVRDMTAYGGSPTEPLIDGILQELSPTREVLFQWNSWDHMDYQERITNSSSDYAHINSIFVDTDGNWLVSSRAFSQVMKIDRGTGEVIWRLGGKSGDFTFANDPFGNLCAQHTASRLENGNILIFDDGQLCWPKVPERGGHTRVVEYHLDEEAMTAELVFSYHRDDIYVPSQGSAQRLRNGNTFIGWGASPVAMATEVDPLGEVVFEIKAEFADSDVTSYRAWRFSDSPH